MPERELTAADRLRRWVTHDVSPVPLDEDILAVCADRDALAATLQRVRDLCNDPHGHLDERAVRLRYERIRAALDGEEER